MYKCLRRKVGVVCFDVFSLLAPELMTMRGLFVARATSMDLRMELINASEEKGFTMPDVPMMEIPPSIPKRGLKVRFAISSPLGTEMVTTIGLGCLDMPIFQDSALHCLLSFAWSSVDGR